MSFGCCAIGSSPRWSKHHVSARSARTDLRIKREEKLASAFRFRKGCRKCSRDLFDRTREPRESVRSAV
jgi:hypothetical protein